MGETVVVVSRGSRRYVIPTTEIHDVAWTAIDKQWFAWAVAAQEPNSVSAMHDAYNVARMWIYHRRGCGYPAEWTTRLAYLDSVAIGIM